MKPLFDYDMVNIVQHKTIPPTEVIGEQQDRFTAFDYHIVKFNLLKIALNQVNDVVVKYPADELVVMRIDHN
ncbi:hypothetical protein [Mucilaginibacter sp.]|uniref:hypothetical protein n=1 Tax=Mucilaginibacter sp. TaxID=1882438 RepID=UPI0035BC4354